MQTHIKLTVNEAADAASEQFKNMYGYNTTVEIIQDVQKLSENHKLREENKAYLIKLTRAAIEHYNRLNMNVDSDGNPKTFSLYESKTFVENYIKG